MIEIAKNKSEKKGIPNIEFKIGDIDIIDKQFKKRSFDVIMAFNILYFVKDIESIISQINQLLKPEGVFVSATDCLGEDKSISTQVKFLLSRIGVIPYMQRIKIKELHSIIKKGNFTIIESYNLYDFPPNHFVVAKKNEKIAKK